MTSDGDAGPSPGSIRKLRARWTADMIDSLNQKWFRKPRKGRRSITGLRREFGEVDVADYGALVDLRGAHVYSVRWTGLELVDFSASKLGDYSDGPLRFVGGSLIGEFGRCLFRSVAASELGVRARFTSCDFSNSKLTRTQIHKGSHFEECLFDGADLSRGRIFGVEFRRCSFRSVNFKKMNYIGACLFEDCVFDGSVFDGAGVTGTRFVRCSMRGVAGTAMIISDLVFDATDEPAFEEQDFEAMRQKLMSKKK